MKILKIEIFILYCLIAIYVVINCANVNWLFVGGLFLPICSWVIVILHELSHWLCFRVFGFCIKDLKIGFFHGFCTIENPPPNCVGKLVFSLMAGGASGFLTSVMSLLVIALNIVSEKWIGIFASLFGVGLYSFYATLLSPRSVDRKLIKEIIREELAK